MCQRSVVTCIVVTILFQVPAWAQLPTGRDVKAAVGYPDPQDLAQYMWARIPAKLKQDNIAYVRASYQNEERNRVFLEAISIDGNGMRMWDYMLAIHNGSWYIVRRDFPRVYDRLEVEYYFWNVYGQVIFPPVADADFARTLYGILLNLDSSERSRLVVQPTMQVWRSGGRVVRTEPAVQRSRDAQQLLRVVKSWRQYPPDSIGLTVAKPDKSAVLWVKDGETLWAFLWRLKGDQYQLNDWTGQELRSDAKARLCVIPIKQPKKSPEVDGPGTVIPLTSLLGTPFGQQLLRFFRIAALNNREKSLVYWKDRRHGDDWWQTDAAVLPALQISDIHTERKQNGIVDVWYQTSTGRRTIWCKVKTGSILILGSQ